MRPAYLFAFIAALFLAMYLIFARYNTGNNFSSSSPDNISVPSSEEGSRIDNQETSAIDDSAEKSKTYQFPGVLTREEIFDKEAIISTGSGDIVIQLQADAAPMAVSNFVYLAQSGFYDNLTFHRVESGFVAQGGDPMGNGTGGPGYQFTDEPVSGEYKRGTVAMANAGPNTNGSQFFIVLKDQPNLPKLYTIFGVVNQGMEAVDSIRRGDKIQKITIQ